MNETCERYDDEEGEEVTLMYVAEDGGRMSLHPSCFADIPLGETCDDEDDEADRMATSSRM